MSHRRFGSEPVPDPGDAPAVAIAVVDGFADPPGLAVREDVLAAVGGPAAVRAGALADLVARIEAAGHPVEQRHVAVPRRRAMPAALLREGSGRLWLFRRHPERFPLPLRPSWRLPFLAVGALHANGVPLTRPNGRAAGR